MLPLGATLLPPWRSRTIIRCPRTEPRSRLLLLSHRLAMVSSPKLYVSCRAGGKNLPIRYFSFASSGLQGDVVPARQDTRNLICVVRNHLYKASGYFDFILSISNFLETVRVDVVLEYIFPDIILIQSEADIF